MLLVAVERGSSRRRSAALLSGRILDGATIRLDADGEELRVTWRNPGAGPSTDGDAAAAVEDTETVGAGSPG